MPMRKITKVFWLFTLVGSSDVHSALAEQWGFARDLRNPPYLIEHTGESVLLYKSGDRAGGALVVFREAYPRVLATLLQKIESGSGIAAKEEFAKSSIINMFEPMARAIRSDDVKALWLHSWKADSARLNQAGFVTNGFRETRIESKPFNRLPNRGAFSVVSFHVLDAADLFGIPGTVMFVYRQDSANEWGWHNAHDPFSFGYKLRVERQFTSHEKEIIEAVSKAADSPCVVIPIGSNSLASYIDEWTQGRAWISDQTEKNKGNKVKLK